MTENRKPTDGGASDFMDLEGAAKYLGLDERVVSELIEQGKMPVIRFGDD